MTVLPTQCRHDVDGLGEDLSALVVLQARGYRLATFWLPILPGWIAFGWLRRTDRL